MPRPSIEYLNARHGISRGAIRSDRLRDGVSDRARDRDLDVLDVAHESVLATFADFRSWFRSLPSVGSIADGTDQEVF
jgi:hypothetical protein